jgi:segregation and condensation protein B
VAREFEPAVGQWYENIDESESFRVLSVDEDAELVEIEYLDGDIEEIDLDTWAEFDLDKIEQPEGWSGDDIVADDDEEEEEEEEEDEDDDWDEDDDDDDDDDDWDEDEQGDDNY